MNTTVRLLGVEEAVAKLKKTDEFFHTRHAVDEAGKALQKALQVYPAERHGPMIYSLDPEKAARQRRWIFWALKNGGLIPYRRTRTLARGWKYDYRYSRTRMTATLVNSVPYASLVQDEFRMTRYHRITGWRPAQQVAKEMQGPVANIVFAGLRRDVENP